MEPLIAIRDLSVEFETDRGPIEAVDGLTLDIAPGEFVGLVGESGSGKSVTSSAILRLIRRPGLIRSGRIDFEGRNLLELPEEAMRRIRGARIAMIFQTPRTALNPVLTIGHQIARLFSLHRGLGQREATAKAVEMLEQVGIPEPTRRMKQYAHQLSGGMCQRVMIAMALATQPRLLIADEPTTGLDVSIAARILELLRDLGRRNQTAVLLITHDLGVVAQTCDRVAVMHAGQLVEIAPVRQLFHAPAHPYTRALVASIPRVDRKSEMKPIPGSVPSVLNAPPGCRYASRCPLVEARCRESMPAIRSLGDGHQVACYRAEESHVRVAA